MKSTRTGAQTGLAPRAAKERGYFLRQKITPWLILLLPVAFTLWLKYIPILRAVYISFFNYDPIRQPGEFVGLGNYRTMFATRYYWEAWGNHICIPRAANRHDVFHSHHSGALS